MQEGRTLAKSIGGDQRSHTIESQADLTQQTYTAKPELFLHELGAQLAQRCLQVRVSQLGDRHRSLHSPNHVSLAPTAKEGRAIP